MTDLDKFIAAVARMRRPVIMLNPADYTRLHAAVAIRDGGALVPLAGIAVASDESVPVGEMRVVEIGGG